MSPFSSVLITGASSGIGAALASAAEGVTLHYCPWIEGQQTPNWVFQGDVFHVLANGCTTYLSDRPYFSG